MKTRYIVPIGTRIWQRVYWDRYELKQQGSASWYAGVGLCPGKGVHNAMKFLVDIKHAEGARPENLVKVDDFTVWPDRCEDCGAHVPAAGPDVTIAPSSSAHGRGTHVCLQIFSHTLYGTPDGKWTGLPQIGDLYYANWYDCDERGGRCIHGWTNCDGRHLICMLPGRESLRYSGRWWDIDGRASNCTLKTETTHRCWVRTGRPELGELVHVSKVGHTCNAGAGSIAIPGWHGFLHNGDIHERCTAACSR